MSAEAMLRVWRELVEPAVTGERTAFEEYGYTPEEAEERRRRIDEEPTWPGVDRLPTVEKGESDADER